MGTVSDLRKGLAIVIDDAPYVVTSFEFVKPGKGQALYRTRLRNLLTGAVIDKTYRSGETLESATLDRRSVQYLYNDGVNYYFMDTSSYEQIALSAEALEDALNYLTENMTLDVLFFRGKAIAVEMPNSVNLRVTGATPWSKGDTSGSDSRLVTVETGYELRVPTFVREGDLIQIDTRSGAYLTRAKE